MSYLTSEIEDQAIKEAAKLLLPEVMDWLEHAFDENEILDELTKILDTYDLDGYALAQALDSWSPNAELVEILNQAGHLISSAESKLVKERLRREDIKPKLGKGAKVKVPGKFLRGHREIDYKKEYEGTISSIDYTGNYVVNSPEAGHVDPNENKSGTTGAYIFWHDLEDANQDLLLPPNQNSDIIENAVAVKT